MATRGLGSLMKGAGRSPAVTEQQLLTKAEITPSDVINLKAPTTQYLCKTTDNKFGIEFTAFKLRDLDRGLILFEIAKPDDAPYEPPSEDDDDSGRFVDYRFTPDFLRLRTVGATVTFRVGDEPVPNFRMIERHFFRNKLLKSFDFDFGFCIPASNNTCEHIYQFPTLTEAEIEDMIASPGETKSDSFYFVDGKLVMHNRAVYSYDA
ncbi:uncharacterized protein MONBRDRAFT_33044 [Monosiga brevicollis MX1]|uniref:GMP phosphodiesterase delta subunit domain-containing protein n=1 Tax=Monosiga brevicollis TaxID=81824 RepID=A9V371_MONBE|nr:uncharacterized protein MONBRDRAFT_33044 [Monosiga brevicollis MX1]EDQ88137.1 predicted protein [Monosiga brevicollis MX1]|eukprot:XP_001747213.1 hypothetical protein [Monosiga brevicollis MX1]